MSRTELISKARWFIHGAYSLCKALLGFDKAPKEDIRQRRAICLICDQYTGWRCKDCGCFIPAKIRILSEMCPLYKWD